LFYKAFGVRFISTAVETITGLYLFIYYQMQISNYQNAYSTSTKTLHFKLLDRDVRFFAPGTSSAVLWEKRSPTKRIEKVVC